MQNPKHQTWILNCLPLLILFFVSNKLSSQNLVPNPSFEEMSAPVGCYSSMFNGYVTNWSTPNSGTSDLLSTSLSPDCIVALPQSTNQVDYIPRGYQLPRTGNNVAGIKPLNDSRREYLQVELTCSLTPGYEYYAEMYVNLAEQCSFAQNNLGMYFSDSEISVPSFEYLSFTPQINEISVISDSINWVKISGTFTASSNHRYLLIGNFFNQASTSVLNLGTKYITFPYYYIDDVSVTQVTQPTITIVGDTAICKGEALTLSASGADNLVWYTSNNVLLSNTADLTYYPKLSGTLQVRNNNCSAAGVKNQEFIIFSLPEFTIGNDTLICNGSSYTLNAPVGLFDYQWNDESTLSSVQVIGAGWYWLEASDVNGCVNRDSMKVDYYPIPLVNLGDDLKLCTPTGTLQVPNKKSFTYEWNTGTTNSSLEYSEAGTYWVTVKNICGDIDQDTITISKIEMYIPNLITANDDSINDFFAIQGVDQNGYLKIFNRYGAKIFEDSQYGHNWSGKNLNEGIYYFEYEYPSCPIEKGWLHLLK